MVVVDFTNNATQILKAFAKYRTGMHFDQNEPDEKVCLDLHKKIIEANVFTAKDAEDLIRMSKTGTDAQLQFRNVAAHRMFGRIAVAYAEVFENVGCAFLRRLFQEVQDWSAVLQKVLRSAVEVGECDLGVDAEDVVDRAHDVLEADLTVD